MASALVPGWGQLLVGRRRLGVTLLGIDLLFLLVLVGIGLWFPSLAVKAWVNPAALLAIFAINIGVLLYRGAAAADGFTHAGRPQAADWAVGLIAVGLLVIPHLMVGNLLLTQNDLLTTVFAEPESPAAPPPPVTTTTTAIVEVDGSGETTTSASTPAPTLAIAEPRKVWDGYERLNILLLGSDAGVGRIGTRTDTIILLSIEPESGDIAMFSVPRNLTEAPLPEGMGIWPCNCFPDIITHLWANGEWYPDAFPGPQSPSLNALKGAIGLIFDVDIHYYAKVDLAGFAAIVDAVGGVTIDVPKRLVDEAYPHESGGTEYLVFEVGEQHFDGHLALAYSRIRRHSGDFARMHRQRCVLGAMADQIGPLDIFADFDQFSDAVKTHVETDIPIDRLGDMVELLFKVDTDRFGTLRITRYNYATSGHAGYQLYDLDRIKADAAALMNDPTIHLESQDGAGLDATCDQSFD